MCYARIQYSIIRRKFTLPGAISTVCHCGTPMAWSIIVHSGTKQVIEPSLYFAINCCREYELQITVSSRDISKFFSSVGSLPADVQQRVPGLKELRKQLKIKYKEMSTYTKAILDRYTEKENFSKQQSPPVCFPCDVGKLNKQEPHGLQMCTAFALLLHPIPAQINLIIPT